CEAWTFTPRSTRPLRLRIPTIAIITSNSTTAAKPMASFRLTFKFFKTFPLKCKCAGPGYWSCYRPGGCKLKAKKGFGYHPNPLFLSLALFSEGSVSSVLARFLFLQLPPHDLAGGRLGQRVDEVHQFGALVGRHLLVAPGNQRFCREQLVTGRADHHGLDGLATALVRRGDHTDLLHARVGVDQRLDFRRPDLVTRRVDHPLDTVDQIEIALLIVIAQV